MRRFSQVRMDWDNLKFFLALAETGSLSRASERLQVDHSTVARRIESLEQELGVRLVERLARSYRLTAEGERSTPTAHRIEPSESTGRPRSSHGSSRPASFRCRRSAPACASNSSAKRA